MTADDGSAHDGVVDGSSSDGWRSRLGAWWQRHRRVRRATAIGAFVVVAGAGALVAVLVAGSTSKEIGPFDTTLRAAPGRGGTEVTVAPFGRIDIDSHAGPVGLDLRVEQLREREARAIAEDPEGLSLDEDALTAELRDGIRALLARGAVAAVVGGAVAGFAVSRRGRGLAAGALVGLVLVGASASVAARTWNAEALSEPRYHGLLRYAPEAVGDVEDVVDRLNDYQAQVVGIIENVLSLYQGATEVRSFQPDASTTRVLHVSDIHLNPQAFDLIQQVADQFDVDVVVDTGDINDWGTTVEGRFADRIGALDVPYVYIRGNHDSSATARAVAAQPNARVLDGSQVTIAGLRIWGVGDPRFTPDKSRAGSGDDEQQVAADEAPEIARRVRSLPGAPPDVVLVHDPATAEDLGGLVPLVLAGHRHRVQERLLGDGTRLLVEGSTGGAGLRGLQRDEAVPLSCSVLYFDTETGRLEALDRIEVAGINEAEVRIEREVLDDERADPSSSNSTTSSSSTSTSSTSSSSTTGPGPTTTRPGG